MAQLRVVRSVAQVDSCGAGPTTSPTSHEHVRAVVAKVYEDDDGDTGMLIHNGAIMMDVRYLSSLLYVAGFSLTVSNSNEQPTKDRRSRET